MCVHINFYIFRFVKYVQTKVAKSEVILKCIATPVETLYEMFVKLSSQQECTVQDVQRIMELKGLTQQQGHPLFEKLEKHVKGNNNNTLFVQAPVQQQSGNQQQASQQQQTPNAVNQNGHSNQQQPMQQLGENQQQQTPATIGTLAQSFMKALSLN